MPQAPCGAGLRILTPTRQVATILYRLVGGTVPRNNQARRKPKLRIYHYMPIDTLPIPYTLTDFGKAYLEQLRAREAVEELVLASLANSESPRLQLAARRLRSPER